VQHIRPEALKRKFRALDRSWRAPRGLDGASPHDCLLTKKGKAIRSRHPSWVRFSN
jgi:hypothetical protein